MKIATWNINGIKARIEAATTWLKAVSPDIACFQEIKCVDEAFPKETFEDLGYNVAVHGQKGFNGVALLSKLPFDEVHPRLAGNPDDVQARYLEGDLGALGRAPPHQYLSAQRQSVRHREVRLQARLDDPAKRAHQSAAGQRREDGHCRRLQCDPGTGGCLQSDCVDGRRAVPPRDPRPFPGAPQSLRANGFAFRACHDEPHRYTFWDYQAGAYQKNQGLRIDHLLLSPQAADRLQSCEIDASPRSWEKPSDHVPIAIELAL